jgi:hypothetical protein
MCRASVCLQYPPPQESAIWNPRPLLQPHPWRTPKSSKYVPAQAPLGFFEKLENPFFSKSVHVHKTWEWAPSRGGGGILQHYASTLLAPARELTVHTNAKRNGASFFLALIRQCHSAGTCPVVNPGHFGWKERVQAIQFISGHPWEVTYRVTAEDINVIFVQGNGCACVAQRTRYRIRCDHRVRNSLDRFHGHQDFAYGVCSTLLV